MPLTPKTYPLKLRHLGFSLIELMVTIAILGMVLVIISGLASYTSGRLKSNQLRVLNDALRQSLSVIGQKMHNANDKVPGHYGFTVIDGGKVLMIISGNDVPANKTCTYFGNNGNSLQMTQDASCPLSKTVNNLTNPVTPSKIFVTDLIFTPKHEMIDNSQTDIPQVEVIINAYDKTDPKKTEVNLQTTFTMDGENVKYLIKNP